MTILAILFLAATAQAAQPAVPVYDSLAALTDVNWAVIEMPQAYGDDDEGVSLEQCSKVIKNLNFVWDKEILYSCSAFYWHNGGYDDPPSSYNNVIKIHYRLLTLDPRDVDTYGTTAWLLWSKWVTWKKDPQAMPDGEGKKDESIRIFDNGITYNRRNALFYNEYAGHMLGFLKDYERAIELYKRTDELATDNKLREQARLNVARCYRHIGQNESAIIWYKAVLEINPQNQNAINALAELEAAR